MRTGLLRTLGRGVEKGMDLMQKAKCWLTAVEL